MSVDVICLRPAADFARAGVDVPQNLRVQYRAPDDSDVPMLAREARAMVIPAVGPKLSAALFEGSRLGLVQVTGAGVDRLDRAALVRLGIPVANVPGGSNAAVAEYAVAAASLLLRRFAWCDREIRNGSYVAARARLLTDNIGGLDGLLVGVVGMGTIGTAVARAFMLAGCRICYYDPMRRDAVPLASTTGAPCAEPLPLEELLATADVVTLHLPLLPSTRNCIDAAALARMKRTAVLINAARGGIVDETALASCLIDGRIEGAAVDVYSTEPPPSDNPLVAIEDAAARRLLLTPHIAGVTRQSAAFLFREAWDNVAGALEGRPLRHRVY